MNADPAALSFAPPYYLRSPLLQTFLGSKRPGRMGTRRLLASGRNLVLDLEGGVRLSGALSPSQAQPARGVVILLHGWEGSMDSAYVVATARHMNRLGFSIFRLNLRDHGNSHGLNRGLFYATLLDEVYQAVVAAARLHPLIPVILCGFSLGGNFALRIARRWSQSPPQDIRLAHVVAVSPVLDPSKATDAIDGHRIIRRYFRNKWQRSLRVKQRLFPDRYDFSEILKLPSIRQMTEKLLQRYSAYPDAAAYFREYTLCGPALAAVSIPTALITATDDPIIPVEDFHRVTLNRFMRLVVHANGGHNGFICSWRGGTWYERYLTHIAESLAA